MIVSGWWSWESAPTASEWQAIWTFISAVATVFALIYAAVQLKQVKQSNDLAARAAEESARANEISAQAFRESIRPYVQVELLFEMQAPGNPKESHGTGMAYIKVSNRGQTPARNLTMVSTPPFRSSGRGQPSGTVTDPVQDGLDTVFSGEHVISMLAPGQEVKFILDFSEELLSPENDLPDKYEITSQYFDSYNTQKYCEQFILDTSAYRYAIAEVQPVDVIARQFRRLNEKGLPSNR